MLSKFPFRSISLSEIHKNKLFILTIHIFLSTRTIVIGICRVGGTMIPTAKLVSRLTMEMIGRNIEKKAKNEKLYSFTFLP